MAELPMEAMGSSISMGTVPHGSAVLGPPPGPPPPRDSPPEAHDIESDNDMDWKPRDRGPAPGCGTELGAWWCNFMNPMGYSKSIEKAGFANHAFISPKEARWQGRRIMFCLFLVLPLVGIGLGFGLSPMLDTPDILLYTTVPIVLIWLCGCYGFSYCVFGRILRFERPSRQYGYTWPYTFECGFMAMILLFLLYGWWGVLFPCTLDDHHSSIVVLYVFFMVIVIGTIWWIVTQDPSEEADMTHVPAEHSEAKNQWCIFCSARAKIKRFDGPWKQVQAKLPAGETVTDCYYPHRRRRHCQSCQKCVMGFDHHCYYLNTCICDRNYTQFVIMLTSLFLMILVEFVYCVLVLVNHFDHNNVEGTFGGALNNQDHIMRDVYGTNLFVVIVFLITGVAAYAMWFLWDLLYLHYYFIYRTIKSPKGSERFTTLDYLHEQRVKKMEAKIQEAKNDHAGDQSQIDFVIQEQKEFYLYNRANYQYHDEIDMTGQNTTDELNIQHGHAKDQLEHLQDESGGLHCTRACGLVCYKLERQQVKCAGMDVVQDEARYFEDNFQADPNAAAPAVPEGATSHVPDGRSTAGGMMAEMNHNPEMVSQMYEFGRASFLRDVDAAAGESPPEYGIHVSDSSMSGAQSDPHNQSFSADGGGGIQMSTFNANSNAISITANAFGEGSLNARSPMGHKNSFTPEEGDWGESQQGELHQAEHAEPEVPEAVPAAL